MNSDYYKGKWFVFKIVEEGGEVECVATRDTLEDAKKVYDLSIKDVSIKCSVILTSCIDSFDKIVNYLDNHNGKWPEDKNGRRRSPSLGYAIMARYAAGRKE